MPVFLYLISLVVLYAIGVATRSHKSLHGPALIRKLAVIGIVYFGAAVSSAEFVLNLLPPLPLHHIWLLAATNAIAVMALTAGLLSQPDAVQSES